MARKRSGKRGDLQPGTLCLIRSKQCPQHNGKVVVVESYNNDFDGYDCSPELVDEADGFSIVWVRASLIPLAGGDGQDEILRLVGVPVRSEEVFDGKV